MNVLKKIWSKVKEYKESIIIYIIMLAVSIGTDIIMGGFNFPKYIAYAVLFIVLITVMIFYKQKIITAFDQAVENNQLYFLKKYKFTIIMYCMLLAVSIASDILFTGFNIIKYIIYALIIIIITILLIKYKNQIKKIIENIETDIEREILIARS